MRSKFTNVAKLAAPVQGTTNPCSLCRGRKTVWKMDHMMRNEVKCPYCKGTGQEPQTSSPTN